MTKKGMMMLKMMAEKDDEMKEKKGAKGKQGFARLRPEKKECE